MDFRQALQELNSDAARDVVGNFILIWQRLDMGPFSGTAPLDTTITRSSMPDERVSKHLRGIADAIDAKEST